MDYGTAVQTGSTAYGNEWTNVQNLMNQIQSTTDPNQLQKLQMQMQTEMQKLTSIKQMIDDLLGMLKKTSEPPHPTQ